MTDRELLEKAAKAARMNIRIYEGMIVERGTDCVCVNEQGFKWNPLTDDGDALRLAVKLNISVDQWPDEDGEGPYCVTSDNTMESHGTDPYAATRRAIVRAAAAIGETL